MALDVWGTDKRLSRSVVAGVSSHKFEEVRARLSRRGPDAIFNAAEAGIYLGQSMRKLRRAIDAGIAPARQMNYVPVARVRVE